MLEKIFWETPSTQLLPFRSKTPFYGNKIKWREKVIDNRGHRMYSRYIAVMGNLKQHLNADALCQVIRCRCKNSTNSLDFHRLKNLYSGGKSGRWKCGQSPSFTFNERNFRFAENKRRIFTDEPAHCVF